MFKKFWIDLHSHSENSRTYNRDVIKMDSIGQVLLAWRKNNLTLTSFTDHNFFNFSFYQEWKQRAKEIDVTLLPGVEIDTRTLSGKKCQIILIFDDNLSKQDYYQIENIFKQKQRGDYLTIANIFQDFDQFKPIYIPHIGKNDYFRSQDLVKYIGKIDLIEATDLKHSNFKSFIKKYPQFNNKIVSFSDTHHWNKYPQYSSLRNYSLKQIESFQEFKLLIKQGKLKYEKSSH